jgi:hypothetical protein
MRARTPRHRGFCSRARNALLRLASLVILVTLAPIPLRAQSTYWVVARDPLAELWYDGLASAGFPSPGAIPLYARRALPEPTTGRSRAADALRAAASRDSTLDVVHFIPLYFSGIAPAAALDAVATALAGGARVARFDPIAERAAAVARAVPATGGRAALADYVDALALSARRAGAAAASRVAAEARIDALQHAWDDSIAPALAAHLARTNRERGALIPVSSLGGEGRVVPAADGRWVVAVSDDASDPEPLAPLLLAVKELAYPLLDAVPAALLPTERARQSAAARAGAMLLGRTSPALGVRYRRLLARLAGADFDIAFPASPALDSALASAVVRSTTPLPAR